MTREAWKAARAAVDAIEAEREALLAPTKERYDAALGVLDAIEADSPEFIGYCEGCGEPIFEGDKYHNGRDVYLCAPCAPAYGDMLDSPEYFMDHDDEPMTAEAAKAIVDKHLAAGGALTDPMAT